VINTSSGTGGGGRDSSLTESPGRDTSSGTGGGRDSSLTESPGRDTSSGTGGGRDLSARQSGGRGRRTNDLQTPTRERDRYLSSFVDGIHHQTRLLMDRHHKKCILNICVCVNGKGNEGSKCFKHNAESCASCNAGYILSRYNNKCVGPYICVCVNGKGNEGSAVHHGFFIILI
jgi:hypothetical protein